ncbi:MAG: hypothetical protein HY775_04915 [Acidobacteria bacterium]|nr:hypothetical protein [Acidobacteriota bacterium]
MGVEHARAAVAVGFRRRLSRRRFSAAFLALALGIGVPPVARAAEPSVVVQHWDLLSETADTLAQATTFNIDRGVLPGGVSAFDPEPTATFAVSGSVAQGAAGSSWTVGLYGAGETPLAEVSFLPADSASTLKTAPLAWPAGDTPIQRIEAAPAGTLAGTFSIRKAYVAIRQEGVILATQGRVPVASKQTGIMPSETWQDVADPSYYRHVAGDFHLVSGTSLAMKLRATASATSGRLLVRLVDSAGEQVGDVLTFEELMTTSSVGGRPDPNQTLDQVLPGLANDLYRVQVKVSGSRTATGDLISADLVLSHRTTDPKGLAATVAWAPGVTAPQDIAVSGSDLGFLFASPERSARAEAPTWTRTVKAPLGAGAADVVLRDRTGSADRSESGPVPGATYRYLASPAAASPAGHVLDSRSALGAMTTGRIAGSALRTALVLGDVTSPEISGLAATPDAISPNGDLEKDSTTITANLSDESPITWALEIRDAGGVVMKSFSGEGSAVEAFWTGRDSSGAIVPDGVYDAVLTATDDWGNAKTDITAVIVDTAGPDLVPESPAPDHNTITRRPAIALTVSDLLTTIDASSPRLSLDGAEAQASFSATTGRLSFTPATDLPLGIHTVEASAEDSVGNPSSATWRFDVVELAAEAALGRVIPKEDVPVNPSHSFPPPMSVTVSGLEASLDAFDLRLSSSALWAGTGTIERAVAFDNLTATFENELGQSITTAVPQVLGLFKHEVGVLEPSPGPLGVNVGPLTASLPAVTVQVPPGFVVTNQSTVSIAGSPRQAEEGVRAAGDPMPSSMQSASVGRTVTGAVVCKVSRTGSELTFDCSGTYPRATLERGTAEPVDVFGIIESANEPKRSMTWWKRPAPNPAHPQADVAGDCDTFSGYGCANILSSQSWDAFLTSYWATGDLFRAYGHHYFFDVSGNQNEWIAAWQAADVQPGSSGCQTARLIEFGDSVESTGSGSGEWRTSGLFAPTVGTRQGGAVGLTEDVLMVRHGVLRDVYRVGGTTADHNVGLEDVRQANDALGGDYVSELGETLDGNGQRVEAANRSALNLWVPFDEPLEGIDYRTRPAEIMTGTEFEPAAGASGEDFALRAVLYFKFLVEEETC